MVAKAKQEENPKIKKLREEDARLVKGKFMWMDCPGGTLSFHYKKYPGEKIKTYSLTDGQDYELPLGVVKHLMSCQVEENTGKEKLVDPYTLKPINETRKISRFSFVTSEYI